MHTKTGEFKRRCIQLITAVLYNSHLAGFLNGEIYTGRIKGVCVPGLNCYSCPGAVASCPLGSLQSAIAKSAYRLPLYVAGMLLLSGILFGRVICAFLCPFGLLQELIYKIPFPKIGKSRITKMFSYLKYVILVIFVIILPVFTMAPGFCKYICPAGTLEAGIPLYLLDGYIRQRAGSLFSWKVIVLILCFVLCTVSYRGFCRFLCPLGAVYSFFNPVSFFGIRVDRNRCTGCNACAEFCKMDISRVGDHECIRCGECREICPALRERNLGEE